MITVISYAELEETLHQHSRLDELQPQLRQ
jgi:hypothetical protein